MEEGAKKKKTNGGAGSRILGFKLVANIFYRINIARDLHAFAIEINVKIVRQGKQYPCQLGATEISGHKSIKEHGILYFKANVTQKIFLANTIKGEAFNVKDLVLSFIADS